MSDLFPKTSRSSLYTIVSERLEYRKLCAKWVPKLWFDHHKAQRMGTVLTFLQRYNHDGDEAGSACCPTRRITPTCHVTTLPHPLSARGKEGTAAESESELFEKRFQSRAVVGGGPQSLSASSRYLGNGHARRLTSEELVIRTNTHTLKVARSKWCNNAKLTSK
ncbi:unnamed protein product [Larinioides sclopetarius]|uniref:Uncharacterized protein n=1 Tax=Larinioides sclopetarius TaxID=280406 RepID=A0AAV1ZEB3_9ARAC